MYLSDYFVFCAGVGNSILSDSESQGISVDLGGLTEEPWLFILSRHLQRSAFCRFRLYWRYERRQRPPPRSCGENRRVECCCPGVDNCGSTGKARPRKTGGPGTAPSKVVEMAFHS